MLLVDAVLPLLILGLHLVRLHLLAVKEVSDLPVVAFLYMNYR